MHPIEIQSALRTMTILVDTREKPTEQAKKRLEELGCPYERVALPFGDYSAKCTLPNGQLFTLENTVTIERKLGYSELCMCFGKDRKRFEREFERAKAAHAKMYLLVENSTMEQAYNGQYRSHMTPQSLVASMFAWLARYDCQLLFCKSETSGKVIHDVLYRELKERLTNLQESEVIPND